MARKRATDHHEGLANEFTAHQDALIDAVRDGVNFAGTRDRLVAFLRRDVLTHMHSEETFLYQAARENGLAELAEAMELDHDAQVSLLGVIETAQTRIRE